MKLVDTPQQPSLLDFAVGNARAGGPSSVEGVGPALTQRILAMVPHMPPELQAQFKIESGERDAAREAIVNPGVKDSRHSHGMAVDLANNPAVLDWIGQHPEYGLGFPLRYMGPKEYNHMEMIDAQGNRAPLDYVATTDTGFKSGLPSAGAAPAGGTSGFGVASANLPPADASTTIPPVDVSAQAPAAQSTPSIDPALLTSLAGGGFNPPGLSSLGGTLAGAVQAQQPVQPPQPILAPNAAIPLSRTLS